MIDPPHQSAASKRQRSVPKSVSLAACIYAHLEEGGAPLRVPVSLAEVAHKCLCKRYGLSPDFVSVSLARIASSLQRHIRTVERYGQPVIDVRFEDIPDGTTGSCTIGVVVTSCGADEEGRVISNCFDTSGPLARLRALRRLSASQFETAVASLMERMGCRDIVVTGETGDAGIDLTARWPLQSTPAMNPLLMEAGLDSIAVLVQAKRYRLQRVSREEAQAFLTAMREELRARAPDRLELPPVIGVIATSSDFTSGARGLCAREGVLCIPGSLIARLTL